MAGKQRRFMGKPITRETINLGVGGALVRDEDFPTIPPRALVTFKAQAKFENIKHKFTDKGTVEESLILTIVTATFEVIEVEEAAEQPELPMDAEVAALVDKATTNEPEGDEPAEPEAAEA